MHCSYYFITDDNSSLQVHDELHPPLDPSADKLRPPLDPSADEVDSHLLVQEGVSQTNTLNNGCSIYILSSIDLIQTMFLNAMLFYCVCYINAIIILQYLNRLKEQLFDVSLFELWCTGADLMVFTVDMDNCDDVGNFPDRLHVPLLYFGSFSVQHFHI